MINPINCLAVDDESLALDLLEDNIKRVPFLHLAGRCKSAYEALEQLEKQRIDLIFLDIQMPGITGVQFLQSLSSRPMVVFITAYRQHALEGFELNVLDYLVKPVSFDRFLKSANKALGFHNLITNQDPPAKTTDPSGYIFVNSEYNLVKIVIKDITHIEGLKDYIKIFVAGSNKPVITRLSMKSIVEKLSSANYIRVHKSFVISIDKITSIRKNRVKIGEIEIPVSEHYRDNLLRIINPTDFQP